MGWVLVATCEDGPVIMTMRKKTLISRRKRFQFIFALPSPASSPAPAVALMASSSSAGNAAQNPRKSLGLVANAMKRKDSFIQLFAMTGIFLLSIRSLGQKYQIHDLQEDTIALKEEQKNLTDRMKNIKRSLLHEASLDSSGLFASRLRLLFGEDHWMEIRGLFCLWVTLFFLKNYLILN